MIEEENTLAALLRDVPRHHFTLDGHRFCVQDGPHLLYSEVLAALAAAVTADLAEAVEVLEGVTLAIDSDDDAYVLPSGGDTNLVALPARGDDYAIQHPEIWQAMVARFNVYPALLARIAAQEAQIKGLEAEKRYWQGEIDTVLAGRADEHDRAEAAEADLAAERAKVAKLVEVERAARKLEENLGVKGVDVGSLRVDLYRALAAITEAGQ